MPNLNQKKIIKKLSNKHMEGMEQIYHLLLSGKKNIWKHSGRPHHTPYRWVSQVFICSDCPQNIGRLQRGWCASTGKGKAGKCQNCLISYNKEQVTYLFTTPCISFPSLLETTSEYKQVKWYFCYWRKKNTRGRHYREMGVIN